MGKSAKLSFTEPQIAKPVIEELSTRIAHVRICGRLILAAGRSPRLFLEINQTSFLGKKCGAIRVNRYARQVCNYLVSIFLIISHRELNCFIFVFFVSLMIGSSLVWKTPMSII